MLKIEYEIKLNQHGRPYIELCDDYENNSEDKFLAIEMTRTFLHSFLLRKKNEVDENTVKLIDVSIRLLHQIGDEMAEIIFNEMEAMGELDIMLSKKFHFSVNTIEERNKIDKYTVANDKIYKKREGLIIYVHEEDIIYELKDGITNENWIKIT
jgi:hypothetical protein